MKNIERQKSLDKQKWEESELQHQDMSGKMPYCDFCDCKGFTSRNKNDEKVFQFDSCRTTQEKREQNCLCAKAFNRLKRYKPVDKQK